MDVSFEDNWITCELLIATGDLRRGDYFEESCLLVESLSLEMFKAFKQTGIYLTDEAQDGQDFNRLRTNDKSKLWQFDYALIPLTLRHIYNEVPLTHEVVEREDGLEIFYKKRRKT